MDHHELKTLQLLDELDRDGFCTQRNLAKKLDVSLGLVNSFIKRLVHKGYVKITTIPKNRLKYILTPVGVAEKTKLTYDYIQHSYYFYKIARNGLKNLFESYESNGIQRIVLYGVSPFSEIAYLSVQETDLEIAAVIDDEKVGEMFMQMKILSPERLLLISFDCVLITGLKQIDRMYEYLIQLDIPGKKITRLDRSIVPIMQ
jgi:DNA-binding MarR family transcriptional regulator